MLCSSVPVTTLFSFTVIFAYLLLESNGELKQDSEHENEKEYLSETIENMVSEEDLKQDTEELKANSYFAGDNDKHDEIDSEFKAFDEDETSPTSEEAVSEKVDEASWEENEDNETVKHSLISYKTFVAWFLEKIIAVKRPEREFVEPKEKVENESTIKVNKENNEGTDPGPVDTSEDPIADKPKSCSGLGCFLKNSPKPKGPIKCNPRNMTVLEAKREGTEVNDLLKVHVFLSQSRINDAIKNRKPEQGDCLLMIVFAPHCRLSVRVAPYINALARAFPLLEVGAIDALNHHSIAHKFGIVGVPSLILFQNNKLVSKLNDTEGLDPDFKALVQLVASSTGLSPNETATVEDSDFLGPLKSFLVEETDIYLVLSWLFLFLFGIQKFLRSSVGRSICNSLLLHWRAAQEVAGEAQQEHPHGE